MPLGTENLLDQLYCLIVSQLLNDGYTSLASTLTDVHKLDRYGKILASNELYSMVFEDQFSIQQRCVEGDTNKSEEEEESTRIVSNDTLENHDLNIRNDDTVGHTEGQSKPLVKKVKIKARFTYEEDTQTLQIGQDVPVCDLESNPVDIEMQSTADHCNKFPIEIPSKEFENMVSLVPNEDRNTSEKIEETMQNKKFSKLCCYCNTWESNLGEHILENHATKCGKNFKCNICGIVIMKKLYNFNEHLKTHSDAKHFLCPDCGIGFKRASSYRDHLETVHANSNFGCSICGKEFRSRTALRAHHYTHTKEYSLPCKTCGKCFRYSRDLANHELTHTGGKPYKCSVCDKDFRTQSHVLRHIKHQHGTNTEYQCGLCPYRVIQKCNLKIHMKKHTGVKYGELYLCPECFCGFPTSQLLDTHTENGCN